MNINPAEIPKGSDYQWAAKAVCGDESLGDVGRMEKTGWRRVPLSRHPNLRSLDPKWVEDGGLVLMERPQFLTDRAKQWEQDKADAQVVKAIKDLGGPIGSPWTSDVHAQVFTSRQLNWNASPIRKTTIREWFVRNWWTFRVWCRNKLIKEVRQ